MLNNHFVDWQAEVVCLWPGELPSCCGSTSGQSSDLLCPANTGASVTSSQVSRVLGLVSFKWE